MKDFFVVILKGLLWLLIVLLLRPLNYVLDWSISTYIKLRDDDVQLPSKSLFWSLLGIFLLICLTTLILYIYG